MLFNSIDFMCFFPIILLVYFIVPKKSRYIWLLVVSYYFYMDWNARYALLIALSTMITYLSGVGLQWESIHKNRIGIKKGVVAASVISNLGILGFFKYFDFAYKNINFILRQLHIEVLEKPFDVILPVGISFYTFQALSYTLDVYRGQIKAEKNLLRYALFVSFFPQLVAGPIERSGNLLTQIQNIHKIKLWNPDRIVQGFILMVWGYFQKMVIADRVAILVDYVFDNYFMYGSTELCLAVIFFALQIYCDFGSYSMIAIGATKIMGISLMENFNTPYFAESVRDFWRRWHVSLSSWLKDYVYIPLGGSRCGRMRKYCNTMITFLVSGIWHGANWSFVVWGGIHGIYQIAEDIFIPVCEKINERFKIKTQCFSHKLLRTGITFILVDFAWLFFRAGSVRAAIQYIKRILVRPTPWNLFNGSVYTLGLDRVEMNILSFALLILLAVDLVRYKKKMTLDVFLLKQNMWFSGVVLLSMIVFIFIYGEYGPAFDAQQFIYFQF